MLFCEKKAYANGLLLCILISFRTGIAITSLHYNILFYPSISIGFNHFSNFKPISKIIKFYLHSIDTYMKKYLIYKILNNLYRSRHVYN